MSRPIVKTGEARRADGNGVLGTPAVLQLTCHATSTWLGSVQMTWVTLDEILPFSCNSSSWLFSAAKIWGGCIQQSCMKQLLRGAFCPLLPCVAALGTLFVLAKVQFCTSGAVQCPTRKGIVYSKCKDKYLPEFICNNTTGKLFKNDNNNNNNNEETSQEIKEQLIPLPGLIYFYTSNNKEIGNELHLLSSIQ